MEAIEKYTRPTRSSSTTARTATLYTGRRALQTTSFNNMVANGDWFMQNKKDNYSQVVATADQLAASGFELVWEDDNWRLWRIPKDRSSWPRVHPMFSRVRRPRRSGHRPDTSGWEVDGSPQQKTAHPRRRRRRPRRRRQPASRLRPRGRRPAGRPLASRRAVRSGRPATAGSCPTPPRPAGGLQLHDHLRGRPAALTPRDPARSLRRHRRLRGMAATPRAQQRAGIGSRSSSRLWRPSSRTTRWRSADDARARRRHQRGRRVRQPGRHGRSTAPAASPRGARG